jgi:hypothetical protein
MSKSRPQYAPLRMDRTGLTHLVVTDLADLPPGSFSDDLEDAELVRPSLEELQTRLARAGIGLRLYAIGTETFLWDVHRIAQAAGLGAGEFFCSHAGSAARRVYCTHCKTMNENTTTSIVTCRGCGAQLSVRDHFSRRLAAFMGVAVDAEVPGEIPAAEVLYP